MLEYKVWKFFVALFNCPFLSDQQIKFIENFLAHTTHCSNASLNATPTKSRTQNKFRIQNPYQFVPFSINPKQTTKMKRKATSPLSSSPKRHQSSSPTPENDLKSWQDVLAIPSRETWPVQQMHHFRTSVRKLIADQLFADLRADLRWAQTTVNTPAGRKATPRLVMAFGEVGKVYKYSGRSETAEGWGPLKELRDALAQCFGSEFNFCHAVRYRNGKDCIGWHADNEKGIDQTCPIVSVSFGGSRDFNMRMKGKRYQKLHFTLSHADVFAMMPGVQEDWEHTVPRRANQNEERINLTFRVLK